MLPEYRKRHVTLSALNLAVAVIESAPRQFRAESDLEDMKELLAEMADAGELAMFERSAWNVLASVGVKPRQPDGADPRPDPAP